MKTTKKNIILNEKQSKIPFSYLQQFSKRYVFKGAASAFCFHFLGVILSVLSKIIYIAEACLDGARVLIMNAFQRSTKLILFYNSYLCHSKNDSNVQIKMPKWWKYSRLHSCGNPLTYIYIETMYFLQISPLLLCSVLYFVFMD